MDELGHGPRAATFLARRLNHRDRRVLKRHQIAPEHLSDVCHQMKLVLERSKGFAHPNIILPGEILSSNEREMVTVSRFVPGLPLNELLVRRGRFPAAVVFEIGRQLLDGLSALHPRSLVHGDIRMSNVRLTDHGLAVLVDGGIRSVVHPEITIHDTMALEAYDGIAPELIGTGEARTASSELYSLGCLLWQLLAGRPPYTTADPLAKLAAHQTSTIDDVRTWAPDTPAILAKTIRQLTSPNPDSRPRSFSDVLQQWGKPGSFSRSRLKQFRRLFDADVPHFARPASQDKLGSGIWIAALLFAASGGAAVMYDNGLRNELLEIVHPLKSILQKRGETNTAATTTTVNTSAAAPSATAKRNRGLLPLPDPQNGVILLKDTGPYQAATINFKGDLSIRSAAGVKPEILIDDVPLRLAASTVVLEGITIRRVKNNKLTSGSNENTRQVSIISQQLQVLNCQFLGEAMDGEATDTVNSPVQQIISVAWRSLAAQGSQSDLVIKNTIFHGDGSALRLAQLPRSLRVSNTLKTGAGSFVSLEPKCQSTGCQIEFNRVTLRLTGPLLELTGEPATKTGAAPIQIQAENSVFQLANLQSGLIVIAAQAPRADIVESIKMNISNSVVLPDTILLTHFDPARHSYAPVPEEEIDEQFDGLVVGEVRFAGNDVHNSANSRTVRIVGPQGLDDARPGINPDRLGPAHRTGASSE